jgi:UDPglucose 6-dehydrogenase
VAERVTVFGAGYVGLITGVCLAHSSHDVTLLDTDRTKLDTLLAGRSPIYEPGLEELLAEGRDSGRLRFAHADEISALAGIVFVAVGTPPTSAGSADLSFVRRVIETIATTAEAGTVVVMKSTVPAGTGTKLAKRLAEAGCAYVSNPEFLREGAAIDDWYHTDRIVLGGDPEPVARLAAMYADIDAPVVACDVTSAEMIKYASNAFLATKVSFINEIASVCDRVGAQVDRVAEGLGMDRRIGSQFLKAGIGYGGSCFPKDTRALDFLATLNGYDFHLLRAVIEVNARQRIMPIRVLKDRLGDLSGLRVAVLGLTFKPGTDDTREAPARELVPMLAAEGADVVAYDPGELGISSYENAPVALSLEAAVEGCAAVVIATEWPQFAAAPWGDLIATMHDPKLVFDGRNCLDEGAIRASGGAYVGIGRPSAGPVE